ncbi:hypothetical protein ACFOY2_07235 [Nonomuraea purpurea]|uniref:Uncharacterized protein n=1 Tax=Nonomuraea purpurea TaxID=1849276 RepID=A0ABV8FZ19_9ACTN
MSVVDVDRFAADGFVKLEAAVPREVGDQARALVWQQIGLSPDDPSGWKQPVVWAADLAGQGPFGEFIRSPLLHQALDEVAGPGGWVRSGSIGNMPIRFPGVAAPCRTDHGRDAAGRAGAHRLGRVMGLPG